MHSMKQTNNKLNSVIGGVPVYETSVNKIDKFAIPLKPRTSRRICFCLSLSVHG